MRQVCTSSQFLIELVASVPFVVSFLGFLISLCFPESEVLARFRYLYVPSFLSCWLAKMLLDSLFNDFHRVMQRKQSAVSKQLILLIATMLCLMFTGTCGIHHLQRAGENADMKLDLFQSFYFIIITFSTVGYGDYSPDYWASQLLMLILIGIAFTLLPAQLQMMVSTWFERQKRGGDFRKKKSVENFVVVCVPVLQQDNILDFLQEFYAHRNLQEYHCVLLATTELDTSVRMLLQAPMWADRVFYIQGSALKNADLEKTRMRDASGCFILAARNCANRQAADEHTILRSWAVKDFAPNCPQYVQIFRPENKMHVNHADYVVCENEFKYAILANNCVCPAISTFLTLLLHTSDGDEGQESAEAWHQVYGKHSGNEIYEIKVLGSKFFSEFVGKSFTYASYQAHQRYGVCLLAVQSVECESLMLNPGKEYTLDASDTCYYISLNAEEELAGYKKYVMKQSETVTSTLSVVMCCPICNKMF